MRWGKAKEERDHGWLVTGAPAPGTEASVQAMSGRDLIAAVDPAFKAATFVAWSKTVYDRAIAAWQTRDPEPLRPVMATAVWDDYARHLLFITTLALARSLMSSARATPALVGTVADGGYQSALIAFEVATDPNAFISHNLPFEGGGWQERWLFQRPVACRTHPSGAVAACPVCGAPAQPEETGRCRYCQADITTRTAGWLVTRTETTMTKLAKMDERLAKVKADMAARVPLPPPPVVAPPLQPPRAEH